MSMKSLKLFTTSIFLIMFLSLGLSFADDFQSYNAITDASFTSNYSLYNTANDAFNIGQAPGDSLSLNIIPGYTHNFVIINESKLNLSYPFEISITLRKGTMVLSANHPKFIFSFFTNASNATDISGSRGYQVVYDLNDSVIDFRRCGVSIENAPCGVSLNNSIMNSSIIGFQIIESGIANLTNDIVFILSIDNSKRFHFYANNIEYMNYYDTAETYLSGGLIFGQQQDNIYNHWHYWDNLNSNVTITTGGATDPNSWKIYGFTSGVENLPSAYATYVTTYYTYQLATTNVSFSTHLQNQYAIYGANKNYDEIKAFLFYLGQPYTEQIRAGTVHILPFMRIKADAIGCYYFNSWNPANHNFVAIPTTQNYYWWSQEWSHDNTGDYIIANMNGFGCNAPNNITVYYDFYNTQSTAYLFTKEIKIPVGYLTTINGTTFTVDYDVPIDCNLNASYCPTTPPINLTITGEIPTETPYESLINRLFQTDIILMFVGLAIAGYLAMIGGMLMGALGFIVWFVMMLAIGLIPLWIGFLLIVLAGLGIAFMIKGGVE